MFSRRTSVLFFVLLMLLPGQEPVGGRMATRQSTTVPNLGIERGFDGGSVVLPDVERGLIGGEEGGGLVDLIV